VRQLKVGESCTGEEIDEALMSDAAYGEKLIAFTEGNKLVVVQDKDTDNYKILAIVDRG